MMLSRRQFCRLVLGATTAAGLATSPLTFTASSGLAANAAHARGNGGGGGGNGGGGGGGNGGSGGSGNGGGGGGGGKGGGPGGGKGNAAGRGRGRGIGSEAARGQQRAGAAANVSIVHANGMRETIQDGRYEMRDAQGRTVINRPATIVDQVRLRSMRWGLTATP